MFYVIYFNLHNLNRNLNICKIIKCKFLTAPLKINKMYSNPNNLSRNLNIYKILRALFIKLLTLRLSQKLENLLDN